MGYAIGTGQGGRDIGYGVIAPCDQPGCDEIIDRGMSYCCGGYFGENADHGCGLYFCSKHLQFTSIEDVDGDPDASVELCPACANGQTPYEPKPDHLDWVWWKLNHDSWETWRLEQPVGVLSDMQNRLNGYEASDELKGWCEDVE